MSPHPLHLVFCESEINRVGFVPHVRAETPESAMTLARKPGVTPIMAERFDETQDWMLDALNGSQLGVAAVHDGLRTARQAANSRSLFWTVFWAVVAAMLFWVVLGLLLSVCLRLR